jgi:hypothetical protein
MFEVGKKVICIKNHSQGIVKKGSIYTLEGIKSKKCKCSGYILDIGLLHPEGAVKSTTICTECRMVASESSERNLWLHSTLFAPYDDSLSETTVEELLNELVES